MPIDKELAVIHAYVWFLVFRNIHLAILHHKACRLCWMACQEASGEDAVCVTIYTMAMSNIVPSTATGLPHDYIGNRPSCFRNFAFAALQSHC